MGLGLRVQMRGLQPSYGKEKREVGVGRGRLTVCTRVPSFLAEVPLPVCRCGSESRLGDSLPQPPTNHLLITSPGLVVVSSPHVGAV